MASILDALTWIKNDLNLSENKNCLIKDVSDEIHGPGSSERTYRVRIFTHTNEYVITISDHTDTPSLGYLGCTTMCRKPRAGEYWHRGNDLPDGPLTESTWRDILTAIIRYELVQVHLPEKKTVATVV